MSIPGDADEGNISDMLNEIKTAVLARLLWFAFRPKTLTWMMEWFLKHLQSKSSTVLTHFSKSNFRLNRSIVSPNHLKPILSLEMPTLIVAQAQQSTMVWNEIDTHTWLRIKSAESTCVYNSRDSDFRHQRCHQIFLLWYIQFFSTITFKFRPELAIPRRDDSKGQWESTIKVIRQFTMTLWLNRFSDCAACFCWIISKSNGFVRTFWGVSG